MSNNTGKVLVLCPCCETEQSATPTGDGRYQVDKHHEPNDSPPCLGNEAKVGAEAIVKKSKLADESHFRQWVGCG